MDSILTSVKKLLGITEEYTHFDADVIMHINSVFSILQQLGVGDPNGFMIFDETSKWTDFIVSEDPRLNMVKTYMFLKVRQMFDPPQSGIVMEAMKRQIDELEWRLNVQVDPSDADNTGYDVVTATDEEIQDLIEDLDSLGKEYYPDPTADQEEIDYIKENLDDLEPCEDATNQDVTDIIDDLDKLSEDEDKEQALDDMTATDQDIQDVIDNLDDLGGTTVTESNTGDNQGSNDAEEATQADIDEIIDSLGSL